MTVYTKNQLGDMTSQVGTTALSWAANEILPGSGTLLSIGAKLFGGSGTPFTAAIGTTTIWGDGTAQTTGKSFNGANPSAETTLVNNMVATYLQTMQVLRGTVPQPYSQFSAGWNQSNNGVNIQYLIGPGVSFQYDYNGGGPVGDFNLAKWQLILLALQHSTFDHAVIGDKLRAIGVGSDVGTIQAIIQDCVNTLGQLLAGEKAAKDPAAIVTIAQVAPYLDAGRQQNLMINIRSGIMTALQQLGHSGAESAAIANDQRDPLVQSVMRTTAARVRDFLAGGASFDTIGDAQIATARDAAYAFINAAFAQQAQQAAAVASSPATTQTVIPQTQTPNVVAAPATINAGQRYFDQSGNDITNAVGMFDGAIYDATGKKVSDGMDVLAPDRIVVNSATTTPAVVDTSNLFTPVPAVTPAPFTTPAPSTGNLFTTPGTTLVPSSGTPAADTAAPSKLPLLLVGGIALAVLIKR